MWKGATGVHAYVRTAVLAANLLLLARARLGYLDLYANDITSFDPQHDKRVDGIEAIRVMLAPLKNVKLPFSDVRYDILDPKVQRSGDAIFQYIEIWYNRKRRHSTLGYISPAAYEEQ